MTINILGTSYEILEQSADDNPKLEEALGICEQYSKKIVIGDFLRDPKDKMSVENFEALRKTVLRHEIIHAFLGESGLKHCSEWAENEEMVDWWANQFEKILQAFGEAGALKVSGGPKEVTEYCLDGTVRKVRIQNLPEKFF